MEVHHLATGLAIRDGALLMVASHYPNHPQPLWTLPGGRQQPRELLVDTIVREFYEETRLRVHATELAYVSESYDGDRHYLNATFLVTLAPSQEDEAGARSDAVLGDHVVAVEWVPLSEVRERVVAGVVREPLVAFLQGVLVLRYAGFREAGITIEWPEASI